MTNLRLRLASAAFLLGPILAGSLVGGCGPSQVETICDALCTCTPCTDVDRADCKDSAETAQHRSEAACAAPFAAYLTCAEDNVRCRDPQALNSKCLAEIKAMIRCDPALAIIGTPCSAVAIKTAVCLDTPVPTGSNQSTCTGQQACIAQCTIAAPCDQIQDVFSTMPTGTGQPLLDCFTACSNPTGP